MPRSPQWFQQLDSALAALGDFPAPVVDRAGLEKLLGVSRRDAIRLLHRFGGYQTGRTFLIGRQELARALEAVREGEDYQVEARRRQRLSEDLERTREHLRARNVKLPIAPEQRASASLPSGMRIPRPGVLEVEFHSAEDLLARLYALVQIAGQDLEAFQRCINS